jgi:hypothetical protein
LGASTKNDPNANHANTTNIGMMGTPKASTWFIAAAVRRSPECGKGIRKTIPLAKPDDAPLARFE